MSKQRITKRELLRRVFGYTVAETVQKEDADERVVLATARALGFTVAEEPALPERIAFVSDMMDRPCKWRMRDVAAGRHLAEIAALHSGLADEVQLVLRELVRRYNARAAVLAVANELEGSGLRPEFAAQRLRAAYSEDAP